MQPLIERLRGEFLEMPGLRLTAAQVQRFCGIDPALCQGVLDVLVEENFLTLGPDGTYGRQVRDLYAPVAKAWLRHDQRRAS